MTLHYEHSTVESVKSLRRNPGHYVYSGRMTPTKQRVVDAAVDLVGTQGLRALTHARVDERAAVPKGSTSNYFRTRDALVAGVVARLAELDTAGVSTAFAPETPGEFVEALCAMLEFITTANRAQTTARLALFVEAAHTPALRADLSRAREGMEAIGVLSLARLGARNPQAAAEAVAACFEGLVLHRIARHDMTDPRPILEVVVRGALA